jgi:hypothetical protein
MLTTPILRDQLWSLLCANFDKRITAQKSLHNFEQEIDDILKEHEVKDIRELIENMKKGKFQNNLTHY